jgi:hypothetical protein
MTNIFSVTIKGKQAVKRFVTGLFKKFDRDQTVPFSRFSNFTIDLEVMRSKLLVPTSDLLLTIIEHALQIKQSSMTA